jgi:fructose-bisphosphate aldolase class I
MKVSKFASELFETAKKIATPGKGILAADESTGTIGSRFTRIKLQNTYENREAYRSMLFTAANLNKFISGVIQFEETISNKLPSGESLQSVLARNGIVSGIKLDKGLCLLANDEPFTLGLDGLDERCASFYQAGLRFAKWRAVIKISPTFPSNLAITTNAEGLAKYAMICQRNGLVPIVEPEVLSEGDHDISKCAEVSKLVLSETFVSLQRHGVLLEGILLKPNMITSGMLNKNKASSEEIALKTVEVLSNTVPPVVPGIMFLSGGQSEEESSVNLNNINKVERFFKPWTLSFSYGRALQHSSITAWAGSNVAAGQKELLRRAAANSLASLGKYQDEKKTGESLHISNYSY